MEGMSRPGKSVDSGNLDVDIEIIQVRTLRPAKIICSLALGTDQSAKLPCVWEA